MSTYRQLRAPISFSKTKTLSVEQRNHALAESMLELFADEKNFPMGHALIEYRGTTPHALQLSYNSDMKGGLKFNPLEFSLPSTEFVRQLNYAMSFLVAELEPASRRVECRSAVKEMCQAALGQGFRRQPMRNACSR